MQKVASTRGGRRRRGATVRRSPRTPAVAAIRNPAAFGVETLAKQLGQCLPDLDGVPTAYSHEMQAELLFDLCAALVRSGIATASHWRETGGNGNLFARQAIREAITQERLDLLQRNIEYHLNIADVIDRFGDERALDVNELVVLVTSGNCGYLEIGAALEALEQEEKGLGAAFYWELTNSLYRVMRLYNHDDAFRHEEYLKESAEEEGDDAGQYEFPDVEKALPKCIRTTLKGNRSGQLSARKLLLRHRRGPFGSWIERLRTISKIARLLRKTGRELDESGYFDSPPLPSLLIAFKQHDAITACFDEESQYMMDSMPEPALSIVFCPRDADEVARTRKVVERFIAINCELFQLVEEIQKLC